MENNTEDQLTLFAGDSHAKTLVQQVSKRASVAKEVPYTAKCLEGLASVCHDTQFLKTSQACLLESQDGGLDNFSMTWPRSGTMQNGTVYALPVLDCRTTVTVPGLLLTPTAQGWKAWTFRNPLSLIRKNHADGNLQEQLARAYHLMITPELLIHLKLDKLV